MIFIDTNAFYYAADISNNPDVLDEELRIFIRDNDIAISSVSFYEFLAKYNNSIDIIHKGATYLFQNNVKIAPNKYFKYPDEIDCDYCNISEEDFEKVLEDVIKIKVDTESRFASIVFSMLLFSAFYFYYIPKGENEPELKKAIFAVCFSLWKDDILETFKKIFEEGYQTDNCENIVRNSVKNLLEGILSISFAIFDNCQDLSTEDDFIDLIEEMDFVSEAQNVLGKIRKQDTSVVYLSKLAKKYEATESDPNSMKYLDELLSQFDNKIPEKGIREYVREIITNSCKFGSPYKKNDILDAMILSNIDEEYQIISFDKGMKRHMAKYADVRDTYKSSLALIQMFEK